MFIDDVKLEFGAYGIYTNDVKSGSKDGLKWTSKYRKEFAKIGFTNNWVDQVHHVKVNIPRKYFADNKLRIIFEAKLSEGIDNESLGIDNFMLSARRMCHRDRACERETPVWFENFDSGKANEKWQGSTNTENSGKFGEF